MQSLTSAQRGALLGHSARVNEEHYTIIQNNKLIQSAREAFGMTVREEKKKSSFYAPSEGNLYQDKVIPFKTKSSGTANFQAFCIK